MAEIYLGSSEGFEALTNGYMEYAKEVITNRAFPDIRDGLKPVQRRVAYSASQIKFGNDFKKSASLVGATLELHPHGDGSVYESICTMVDSNGTLNVPLLSGQGGFGRVFSSEPPAAFRYTKLKPSEYLKYFTRDMSACEMKEAEEGEGLEPEAFPVRFPNILLGGSEGVAVSISTKIPSFNFNDVIDLTIKYIKGKELGVEDIIIPDFPTGGVLIKNDKELAKLMTVGKATLKVRAEVEIEGNKILVKSVPVGRTVEKMISKIKSIDTKLISNVTDTTGLNSKSFISIKCRSKAVVENVLAMLYKENILQSLVHARMSVLVNGEPRLMGVYKIVETWVNWRKGILRKVLELDIEGCQNELRVLSYFTRLVSNEEWRDTFVDKIVRVSKQEATDYLKELFEDIDIESSNWICGRAISAFNNGGKYLNRYNDLSKFVEKHRFNLDHLDEYLISDLEEVKRENREVFERKTSVTNLDYRFSKAVEAEVVDDSYCVWTLDNHGFLKKTRDFEDGDDVLYSFEGQANSVLVGFDSYGRVLRVFGDEIEFTGLGENGTYLPKYFDVDLSGTKLDGTYKILYLGLLDGSERMLVYSDGYVGFFDSSEVMAKKRSKVVTNGVPLKVIDKLAGVIEEKDVKEFLLVADDSTGVARFGTVAISDINKKSRTSSTKVFDGRDVNIRYYLPMSGNELMQFMESPFEYNKKISKLKGILMGDPADVIESKLV